MTTDDNHTPDPTPAFLPPAHLAERERAVSAAESQIVREREGLVDYMHEWHRLDYEAHPGLGTEEIAVEVMRGLRARVAELEAANARAVQVCEELTAAAAVYPDRLAATPPPGTVAALLLKVEEAERDATDCGAAPGSTEEARSAYMGQASGLREAARLITATLGAPTPLDRAVAEVCALLPRVTDDGGIPFSVNMHFWGGIVGEVKGVAEDEDPSRETLLRIVAEGLAALLACDAPATEEPG